jgi:L-lactate dehydrogenase complex protein LldE
VRIALMATCLADAMFPSVARATVTVLERLGHEVVFPPGQTCCGQMHVNTGYAREAVPLVAHHVEVFEEALTSCDAVVAPSGSCVGSVRHQHAMVAEGAGRRALAGRATQVAEKTYELSELLVDVLGVTDVGAYYPHRVTYHPTCHSMRLLRVGDKPLQLLRAVEGLELVELPAADQCCGFGGTFAMKNSATSTAMLEDKMRHIRETGAERCTAGDASCLMHIDGGLRRAARGAGGTFRTADGGSGEAPRTVHLAEILASTRAEVVA